MLVITSTALSLSSNSLQRWIQPHDTVKARRIGWLHKFRLHGVAGGSESDAGNVCPPAGVVQRGVGLDFVGLLRVGGEEGKLKVAGSLKVTGSGTKQRQ